MTLRRIQRLPTSVGLAQARPNYKLFYFLEQHGILDHLNEHHLWAVHYVFLPRINQSLKEFVNSWNSHPIRTANHKSPQQLFIAGALVLQQSGLTAMDFFEAIDEDYGIDPDGPTAADEDQNGIVIPQTTLKFSDADNILLSQSVDPLGPSQDFGIDLYEQTVALITTFTPL